MRRSIFILVIFFSSIKSLPQPPLTNEQKSAKKTFTYKTIGELAIKADLFQTRSDKILDPVIIWIHGGGLIFGSREDLREEQRNFYLNAGYAIVSIDYRLAPETRLPEIVNDVKDAIEWVQQHGADSLGIDPNKVFVIGHSGGAYLALLSGYLLEKPPTAIVSFYGYGDIQSEWYNKPDTLYLRQSLISDAQAKKMIYEMAITSASANDRFNLYLYTRQKGIWPSFVSGHNVLEEKSWFDKYSPLKNFNSKYPPVLLIHGDKDTDVPFEQSVLMNNKLALKKIEHKFIRVDGYGHVFDHMDGGLSDPNIYKVFIEVKDFLNNFK